jgi:hypothetical protein
MYWKKPEMMLIEDKKSESQKRRENSKTFGVGYLWPRIGVLGGRIQTALNVHRTVGPEQRATQRPAKLAALTVQGPFGNQIEGLYDQ